MSSTEPSPIFLDKRPRCSWKVSGDGVLRFNFHPFWAQLMNPLAPIQCHYMRLLKYFQGFGRLWLLPRVLRAQKPF